MLSAIRLAVPQFQQHPSFAIVTVLVLGLGVGAAVDDRPAVLWRARGVAGGLGVYGLFSWSVALRTRELAIRLTLGAKPVVVGALVIRQSAVLVMTGLVIGMGIIRLAESALSRVLFGVTASDAIALVTAGSFLLLAAMVACVPPALRAMRVDPVEGLRAE